MNKLTYNRANKGLLTQKFLENANPYYKDSGELGHNGVDTVNGYGKPVTTDNDGFVYKVVRSESNDDNWQAVYLLCPHTEGTMEVCYGHLSSVLVGEGDTVSAGTVIGYEGNRGVVYSAGLRITAAMQKSGDRRGSHLHTSYRPVYAVADTSSKNHYLRTASGSLYRRKDGNTTSKGSAYEIVFDSPSMKGMVDPLYYTPSLTATERIEVLRKMVIIYSLRLIEVLKRGS